MSNRVGGRDVTAVDGVWVRRATWGGESQKLQNCSSTRWRMGSRALGPPHTAWNAIREE